MAYGKLNSLNEQISESDLEKMLQELNGLTENDQNLSFQEYENKKGTSKQTHYKK
jgi:hypothetical protein